MLKATGETPFCPFFQCIAEPPVMTSNAIITCATILLSYVRLGYSPMTISCSIQALKRQWIHTADLAELLQMTHCSLKNTPITILTTPLLSVIPWPLTSSVPGTWQDDACSWTCVLLTTTIKVKAFSMTLHVHFLAMLMSLSVWTKWAVTNARMKKEKKFKWILPNWALVYLSPCWRKLTTCAAPKEGVPGEDLEIHDNRFLYADSL